MYNLNKIYLIIILIIKKIKNEGLVNTLKIIIYTLSNKIKNNSNNYNKDQFDCKYGTDTCYIVDRYCLDLPKERIHHAVRYQTAVVDIFIEMIDSLEISHQDYFFIDLGSGKGRALMLASNFPFKKIIGVELSQNLNKIAKQNILIYKEKLQRCFDVELVCNDVASFVIPIENIVFYMFNPFDEVVLYDVLENIEKSIYYFPRKIYILYLKPLYKFLFDQKKIFKIYKKTEKYIVYENKLIY